MGTEYGKVLFLPNKVSISVELANTNEKIMNGLMFRCELEDNFGMLFIFSKEKEQFFWMKNTLISLDIIFINEDFQIVNIYENAIPLDETFIPSKFKAKYVIEVVSGFVQNHNIKIGDHLLFN
jgi:uncharacterized membrane protein (UPF0127 family)